MSRPKPLSKTKKLARELRDLRSRHAMAQERLLVERGRAEHEISHLKDRLKKLVGASVSYNPDLDYYQVAIRVERHTLRWHGADALREALVRLFDELHKSDIASFMPDMKPVFEQVKARAAAEFEHLLYPLIVGLARSYPMDEPPISTATYFRLARAFLNAFLEMGGNPTSNLHATAPDGPVSMPRLGEQRVPDPDLPDLLKKLLVMEYGKTTEQAEDLVKKHSDLVVQLIMKGPIFLRAAAMKIDSLG